LNAQATVDALSEHSPRAPPTFEDLPPLPNPDQQARLFCLW
jgi:hypothetical protein